MKVIPVLLSIALGLIVLMHCSSIEGTKASSYTPTYQMPVEGQLPSNLEDANATMEDLTWQRFIAVCWPAIGGTTTPDSSATLPSTNSYTTVWNNYGLNYDLYLLPDGMNPTPIEDKSARNNQRQQRWVKPCPDLANESDASLLVVDEFVEASLAPDEPHNPVIDRNGEYVRASVLYNEKLYEFMRQNDLYNINGLKSYLKSDSINPFKKVISGDTVTESFRVDVPDGSMMLKSSWKVLGNGDDPSKFFTKEAVFVFENGNLGDSLVTSCNKLTIGLVGLHFVVKTAEHPSWIWSTFEHIENGPNLTDQDPSGHYNFFEESSLPNSRGINVHPTPTDTSSFTLFPQSPYWFNPAVKGQIPSQVARVIPINSRTQQINEKYQQILSNTVWKNYALVGTQWEYATNQFSPQLLANTTLETYEQTQASCMGCHNLTSGIGNNAFQQGLGNTPNLYAPITSTDYVQVQDSVQKRILHADWMWTNFKVYTVGQLSWYQVRPAPSY